MNLPTDVPQSESSESDIMSRLTRAVDPGDKDRPGVSQKSAPIAPQQQNAEPIDEQPLDEGQEQFVDSEESSDQEQEQSASEAMAELEHLGKKYTVPASLKTAFEANRAQANKIPQEVAEIRKMLHIERQTVEAKRAFEQQVKPEFDELAQLESQIKQFKDIDWSSLDTDQLVRARQALDTLKERREDKKAELQDKQQKFNAALTQHMEQAKQHGHAYLQKAIPNWDSTQASEVASFALTKGFTQDELSGLYDPRTVEVLWEAMQYRKLQSSKPQVLNKARQAPPVSKPGAVDQSNSLSQSKERVFRDRLKKSGSIEDATAWLLARQKSR